jgi:selenium-binding protein 1
MLKADETCSSPYMARIEGQEEFVYVWTLGVDGTGDGSDKLVVVDVKPGSPAYGKVIHSYSVGGRHEAHHGGFTDDRRQLWLAGLETSKIFIFDVYSDPARPAYLKTIEDFDKVTGGRGGPPRCLRPARSGAHSMPLERERQGRAHCARGIQ